MPFHRRCGRPQAGAAPAQAERPHRRAARHALRAALALAALAGAWALAGCSRPAPPAEPVRAVKTIVLDASNGARAPLEYAAEIRARTEARLGFRVGGKLVARPVEVGQHVRAGETLARLDAGDLRLAQDASQAAVRTAQVNHELAQADVKRFRDLRDQGFISSAELDRRESALKASAAQLEQARAQASVQANQAGYSVLQAPSAGVVLAVDAEPGAVLAVGQSVVRLALDGPRDAVFAVPEDALPLWRGLLGQAGALQVTLWGERVPHAATLRELAAAADSVTRTFTARATLAAAADTALGQTASVRLAANAGTAELQVPLSALHELHGRSHVWVAEPAAEAGLWRVRAQPVELGPGAGNLVAVRSGVRSGERVVVAGVHVLAEGQVVKLAGAAQAASGASAPVTAAAAAASANAASGARAPASAGAAADSVR